MRAFLNGLSYLEHLVGAGLDAGHHVVGAESRLLDLREVVARVLVQGHLAHLE